MFRPTESERQLLVQQQLKKRRVERLQQVRAQSQQFAARVRQRCSAEIGRQRAILKRQAVHEWARDKENRLCQLESEYSACLQAVGSAHQAARQQLSQKHLAAAAAASAAQHQVLADRRHRQAVEHQHRLRERVQCEKEEQNLRRLQVADNEKQRAAEAARRGNQRLQQQIEEENERIREAARSSSAASVHTVDFHSAFHSPLSFRSTSASTAVVGKRTSNRALVVSDKSRDSRAKAVTMSPSKRLAKRSDNVKRSPLKSCFSRDNVSGSSLAASASNVDVSHSQMALAPPLRRILASRRLRQTVAGSNRFSVPLSSQPRGPPSRYSVTRERDQYDARDQASHHRATLRAAAEMLEQRREHLERAQRRRGRRALSVASVHREYENLLAALAAVDAEDSRVRRATGGFSPKVARVASQRWLEELLEDATLLVSEASDAAATDDSCYEYIAPTLQLADQIEVRRRCLVDGGLHSSTISDSPWSPPRLGRSINADLHEHIHSHDSRYGRPISSQNGSDREHLSQQSAPDFRNMSQRSHKEVPDRGAIENRSPLRIPPSNQRPDYRPYPPPSTIRAPPEKASVVAVAGVSSDLARRLGTTTVTRRSLAESDLSLPRTSLLSTEISSLATTESPYSSVSGGSRFSSSISRLSSAELSSLSSGNRSASVLKQSDSSSPSVSTLRSSALSSPRDRLDGVGVSSVDESTLRSSNISSLRSSELSSPAAAFSSTFDSAVTRYKRLPGERSTPQMTSPVIDNGPSTRSSSSGSSYREVANTAAAPAVRSEQPFGEVESVVSPQSVFSSVISSSTVDAGCTSLTINQEDGGVTPSGEDSTGVSSMRDSELSSARDSFMSPTRGVAHLSLTTRAPDTAPATTAGADCSAASVASEPWSDSSASPDKISSHDRQLQSVLARVAELQQRRRSLLSHLPALVGAPPPPQRPSTNAVRHLEPITEVDSAATSSVTTDCRLQHASSRQITTSGEAPASNTTVNSPQRPPRLSDPVSAGVTRDNTPQQSLSSFHLLSAQTTLLSASTSPLDVNNIISRLGMSASPERSHRADPAVHGSPVSTADSSVDTDVFEAGLRTSSATVIQSTPLKRPSDTVIGAAHHVPALVLSSSSSGSD